VIEARRALTGKMLASVRRPESLELPHPRHHVARGRRRPDAIIKRHQEGRLRPAAARARHARGLAIIHLRPTQQIVETADPIPRLVSDDAAAHQQRSGIEQRMRRRSVTRRVE